MYAITIAAPRNLTAIAADLSATMRADNITPPAPHVIADALARWAARLAEEALADAVAIYQHAGLSEHPRRLLCAELDAAARAPAARALPLRDRRKRARQYARKHLATAETWMTWPGWAGHIGCNVCGELGPAAPCWGHIGCHGYLSGCGCLDCTNAQGV